MLDIELSFTIDQTPHGRIVEPLLPLKRMLAWHVPVRIISLHPYFIELDEVGRNVLFYQIILT
jgi:hypothetical protein